MTTYCAPCISDLALVREAVTAVSGTASCMAHAVLLVHPTDDPGRRRQRLAQLRDLAQGKAETASPEEQARLELLVHEYGLAGAMDMGGARRRPEDATRRSGKSRRGRERPGRPEGSRPEGARPEGARPEGARPEGARPEGARPDGDRHGRAEGSTAAPAGDAAAPARAASNGDDSAQVMPSPGSGEGGGLPPSASAPSAPAPSGGDESAPAPAPESAPAPAPEPAPAAAPEPSGPTPAGAPEPPRPSGEPPVSDVAPSSPPAQD